MEKKLIVQDIFIYPIKSLGGIRLSEAIVEEKGFRYDRRWMLVDEEGVFVTQREYPQLALLEVTLGKDVLVVSHKMDQEKSVRIPFELAVGPELMVTIWDDQVLAKTVDPELDQWFSDFLGFRVSLVMMPESTHRKVNPKYAVHSESVSFADGMPYLLIGQESLNDLNSRLENQVPMNRFRPNIVFSGGSPYLEDSLSKIKIGELEFQIVKPCARCVMTTVDQEHGVKGKEPLKTLSTYRTLNGKVYFGQNVVALQSGKIRIGDVILPQD
ncbi:MOSC domain-containing protein [Algoriphagus sp. A40]|uniref:MOSC domain-containing protein n=1 Tax=Algoriphagus sp. A40 TaxID=1945863 RepID=UPI0009849BAD|nr:MOSC N-terminal beta barrel domain-containing protein [Algoriphagus sp. A40]OOG75194.1 MOSC domain-containing protein [Algoriphagus sp. A40]